MLPSAILNIKPANEGTSMSIQRRLSVLIILSVSLAGCEHDTPAGPGTPTDEAIRPNILLIVADDMGYTDIGSFGGEIRTPNLDKLAYGGVRLTNFHVHPSCAPTRAALMSGTLPHVAGMGTQLVTIKRFNGDPLVEARRGKPGYEGHLAERIAPIPALLQNAGYRTFMTGKWHLGGAEEHSPAAKGFDQSFELIHGSGSHFPNTPGKVYRENGKPIDGLPDDFYSTRFFTDKAISYIEESREEGAPWFTYLAYTTPHWPLQVPDDWLDKYEGAYDQGYEQLRRQRIERALETGAISEQAARNPGRPFARNWSSLSDEERAKYSRAMEIYAAMVENLDHHVRRVIRYLEDSDQLDNTIILFMSDNGAENFDLDYVQRAPRKPVDVDNSVENFGRPNSFVLYGPGWAQAGMGPYAYHKGSLGEGGIRAAAFVNHSSLASQGSTDDTFLTVRDLSATILDIAGAEHPADTNPNSGVAKLEGESFWSALVNEEIQIDRPDKVFVWEHDGQVALVRGNWKYMRLESPHGPKNIEPGWHLYNLVDDPGETTDMSDAYPEITAFFGNEWKRIAASGDMVVYPE